MMMMMIIALINLIWLLLIDINQVIAIAQVLI